MSLRDKAIDGVLWNSLGKFSLYGIEFVIGIILARLLTPNEFGMIATIMIVITISEVFVNSGFRQAIIRKQDCTEVDYSTAFFFNLAVGLVFFTILFYSAGWISVFFKNTELKPIIQVLGFGLIINALTFTQSARISKRIDFKLLTKISVIATVLSGIVAVIMAFTGFGVWSLVAKYLLRHGITSLLLWIWNRWKPEWVFSMRSFRELFGFGSKLLLSNLILTAFQNLNYFVIAKYFSSEDLGYYTRAELFKNLLSANVSSIITAVGYPTLAKVQDDRDRMKRIFREMFISTSFVVFILMSGLAATSETLIISLIGDQWQPSVELLQLLCILGIVQPLNSMNISIMNVVGRSDLYLKLQIISMIFAIPAVFLGMYIGIKALIVGRIFSSMLSYALFNHYSSRFINYKLKEQLKDLLPALLLAAFMGGVVYSIELLTDLGNWLTLIFQMFTGMLIVGVSCELFKIKAYALIKTIVLKKTRTLIVR